LPGLEDDVEAFFGGESADEDGEVSVAGSGAGVGVEDVGFDEDFFRWEAVVDEFLARGGGGGDVEIDVGGPGSAEVVEGLAGGDDGGGGAAVVIAVVENRGERDEAADAFFADVIVAKEGGGGADHAEVVKGLNDGGAIGVGGGISGGGNQGEGVVEVDDVGAAAGDRGAEIVSEALVPDGGAGDIQFRHGVDDLIVDDEFGNVVA